MGADKPVLIKKPVRGLNLKESQKMALMKARSSVVFTKAPKRSYFDVDMKEKRPGPAN